MDGLGHRRLSTRSLTLIVFLFMIVALAITVALVGLLLLDPNPTVSLPNGVVPGPTIADGVERRQAASELIGAVEKGDVPSWTGKALDPTPSPLRVKRVVPGGKNRPRWTATPVPTSTPTPSPTPNPTFVSSAYGLGDHMPEGIGRNERWVDVDLTLQKLVAYEGFVPVFETLVSTGTARHPTVTGQFRIWLRFRSQDMDGYRLGYNYYLRDVPFVQYFYEDYALHGTFWHSNFGQPMSHGCVNLATSDAEWLYDWAGYGTLVNVHP
jgi:hypothetical protein